MGRAKRISLSIQAKESFFPKVAETGVTFVELSSRPPLSGRITSLVSALKSVGLTATSLHGPTGIHYDIGNPDVVERERALELHKEGLKLGNSLGVEYYVIHPGFEVYLDEIGGRWDDARKVIVFQRNETALAKLWATNARSISILGDFAECIGVKIALETGPTNLISMGETLRIVREAKSDNVGICLDTGHVNVGSLLKPHDAIKEVGGLLWVLHLHDNNGEGDLHLPPGKGDIDWAEVIRALAQVSYAGTYNIELDASLDWDSEGTWSQAKEAVSFLSTALG